jgi:hypothetical protein
VPEPVTETAWVVITMVTAVIGFGSGWMAGSIHEIRR